MEPKKTRNKLQKSTKAESPNVKITSVKANFCPRSCFLIQISRGFCVYSCLDHVDNVKLKCNHSGNQDLG